VSAQQTREVSGLELAALILHCALLYAATVSLPVSEFPLLFASIWISPPSSFCLNLPWLFSSRISVWVLACGAALISSCAQASRAA